MTEILLYNALSRNKTQCGKSWSISRCFCLASCMINNIAHHGSSPSCRERLQNQPMVFSHKLQPAERLMLTLLSDCYHHFRKRRLIYFQIETLRNAHADNPKTTKAPWKGRDFGRCTQETRYGRKVIRLSWDHETLTLSSRIPSVFGISHFRWTLTFSFPPPSSHWDAAKQLGAS